MFRLSFEARCDWSIGRCEGEFLAKEIVCTKPEHERHGKRSLHTGEEQVWAG